MTAQLVLRFPPAPGYGGEAMLPNGGQDEARAWLGRTGSWPLGRLAIYGAADAGKSHLARDWAACAGGAVLGGAPESWPGTAIAVDSLDVVADEVALLHLINAAGEAGQPLLLVSRLPPGRLPVRLPDLASRLRATTAVEVGPADDGFLALMLARLLADRQLRVRAEVQAWLLGHLPRRAGALREAVARLDAAALEAGRAVTQPFASAVLGLKTSSLPSPGRPGPG